MTPADFLRNYELGRGQKVVDRLHKFWEFAAVDVVCGSGNLYGAAVRGQQLAGALPGDRVEGGSQFGIGTHE